MRSKIQFLAFLLLDPSIVLPGNSFVPLRPNTARNDSTSTTTRLFDFSFMKQKPGESDMEFFKRIQQVASDPTAFEDMVFGGKDKDKKSRKKNSSSAVDANASNEEDAPPKKKNGYQRAEDWDAEVKARQEKGEFTWEEKVQFEGQRLGNQFNQNEILRKNLKGF